MKKFFLFFLVSSFLFLYISPRLEILVLPAHQEGGGLFFNFNIVLGFLKDCEKNKIQNFEVDFGKKGHYYEEALGSNWWKYYFAPVKVESWLVRLVKPLIYRKKVVSNYSMTFFPYYAEYFMPRKKAHKLIQKYIRLKPDIEQEIDQFTKKHFTSFTIGIHYRGTDKYLEAKEVSFSQVFQAVDQLIQEKNLTEFKIFIATDAEPFLQAAQERFPGKILYTKASRSTDGKPLHYNVQTKTPQYYYNQGREAIIDSLLLSRTSFLIRTSSNLSLCSLFYNPDLPYRDLNERHYIRVAR
ncbi:MAG: hypothetical protein HYZ47_03725 [Simkania negevensis]|nr:hypothetical protein [Simkania negevensis]